MWVLPNGQHTSTLLEDLAHQQMEAIQPLADFFERRHWPLPHYSFPSAFARFSDVSVDYMLPCVITDLTEVIESSDVALQEALVHREFQVGVILSRLQSDHRSILRQLERHVVNRQNVCDVHDLDNAASRPASSRLPKLNRPDNRSRSRSPVGA